MAIKISGTTVIDDNRNIQNVGVLTATTFSGSGSALTGVVTTGSGSQTIGGNLTVSGNLTVNGTQTIINTTQLEITDKTVGIASTASPTNAYADGAGIVIYGTTNKTLTWDNSNTRLAFNTDIYAPRYYGDGSSLTGVTAGITLRNAGGVIAGGAATTINFSAGVSTITSVTAGVATITISSGLEVRSGGSSVGTGITNINFASGATVTASGAGSTITISAGIQTAAYNPSGIVTTLLLSSAQDHKVTATGITTITVSGGTEGDSHTVRIVNSGIATVGFSTYFLFPSGSPPSLPTTSGAISIVSFTVHRVGTAGTQLLAGASLNFS